MGRIIGVYDNRDGQTQQASNQTHGDYPLAENSAPTFPAEMPAARRTQIEALSRLDDDDLFKRLKRELVVLVGGQIGQHMLDRFSENRSTLCVNEPGSVISEAVASSVAMRRSFTAIAERVDAALKKQFREIGEVDPAALRIAVTPEDRLTWKPWDLEFGLAAVHGGTAGLQVEVLNFEQNGHEYHAQLAVRILDTFGADHEDVYSPGLRALWILQHQRGVRPFPMETVVRKGISGVLSDTVGSRETPAVAWAPSM